MNIKAFFVDALGSAIDLGIGTPEDVLRHVTPDVLATHLPRPLWARLLTACLGAPKVDATLVIETIGIANLCEHVPSSIIWACLAEIGARSLGKQPDVSIAPAAPVPSRTVSVLSPPPDERPSSPSIPIASAAPVSIGPSIPAPTPTPASSQPLADLITELEQEGAPEPRSAGLRPRSPTSQRFRQSNTAVGRTSTLGNAARRPQASATPTPPAPTNLARPPRRSGTEITDPEVETSVEGEPWRNREVAVDDSQLVDWQADAATGQAAMTDDDFSDLGRKR